MPTGAHVGEGGWSLAGYRALLDLFETAEAPIIDLREFSQGNRGVWLRHDVEIDLGAAASLARVEAAAGVRSWYFVCPESPFIETQLHALRSWAAEVIDLGHALSLHMFLGSGLDALGDRVERAAWQVGIEPPKDLTFHAPGLAAEILAQAPGGQLVYERLATQRCRYLSDSTGRWRWGTPWEVDFADGPTQLLTHPFWWSGERSQVAALCTASAVHAAFLPQFKAEVLDL